jgi:putative ABC transport system permease protein
LALLPVITAPPAPGAGREKRKEVADLTELLISVRSLLRSPLLVVTGVLTLALGIGAATGVFAVAHGLLLRPLPYADVDRLVVVAVHRPSEPGTDIGVGLAHAKEWRQRVQAFTSISGHSRAEFTLRGLGEPRSVRVAMVLDDFFSTLGVGAERGHAGDIEEGRGLMAVSGGLAAEPGAGEAWRGRAVSLGMRTFEISAIMPRAFTYPSEAIAAWVPADAVDRISLFERDDRRFRLVGRLRPGVTVEAAQADAARVANELNATVAERDRLQATVIRLEDEVRRGPRAALVPFVAGAVVLLAIAAANVSALLVGRASSRAREFAVRRALGASAGRIARAVLSEGLCLSLAGWTLGLGVAHLVIRAFVVLGGNAIPNLSLVRLDGDVLGGSLVLAVLVGLASAAPQAARAVRGGPVALLRGGAGRSAVQGSTRRTLVVTQIALTVLLLVCAGLLSRTVLSLTREGTGFELRHGLATRLMLADTVRYRVLDRTGYLDRLLVDIRALPGVRYAGVGSDLPPRGAQVEMTLRLDSRSGTTEIFPLSFSAITPGYLEALGARLVAGRLFEDHDREAPVPSVVISRAAARRVFDALDPIGRDWPASIPTPAGSVRPRVIGVVEDIKSDGLDRDPGATIFAPWEVFAPSQAYLVLRTSGDPLTLAPAVREAIRQLDPALPVYPPESLEAVFAASLAERRLRAQLAGTFGTIAVLLAAVALWGAVAQSVIDRRREIAIRMAVGATASAAVRLVLRSGLALIGVGLTLGLVGAGLAARGLEHLLYRVAPLDLPTFAGVAAAVTLLALLACYLPARSAASVNPAELMREG